MYIATIYEMKGSDFQQIAMSASKAANRKVIKVCTELGLIPIAIYKFVKLTESDRNVSRYFELKNIRMISTQHIRKRNPTEGN